VSTSAGSVSAVAGRQQPIAELWRRVRKDLKAAAFAAPLRLLAFVAQQGEAAWQLKLPRRHFQ